MGVEDQEYQIFVEFQQVYSCLLTFNYVFLLLQQITTLYNTYFSNLKLTYDLTMIDNKTCHYHKKSIRNKQKCVEKYHIFIRYDAYQFRMLRVGFPKRIFNDSATYVSEMMVVGLHALTQSCVFYFTFEGIDKIISCINYLFMSYVQGTC